MRVGHRLLVSLLVGLLAASVSGCAARRINTTMASWVGHHYSDLFAKWGPPQQVFDDGSGGRILVYAIERRYAGLPATSTTTTDFNAQVWDDYLWGSATSYTVYEPGTEIRYTAYRMFWIGRNGRIYRWAWRGL